MTGIKIIVVLLAAIWLFSNCSQHKTEKPQRATQENQDGISLFMAGKISTNLPERDLAISPDGRHIYFTLQSYKREKSVIMRMARSEGVWSEPETASFSGVHADLEPAFSPDGSRLYFVSNRPLIDSIPKKDYDIWYVDRTDGGWGPAKNLAAPVNTEKDEFYPSVVGDGSLYFTATYEDSKGTEDIYVSRFVDGQYQTPVSLDSAINSATYEFNAYVSPDEHFILFSSYGRSDDLGGGDLYMSVKKGAAWQPAFNLGPLMNSKGLDYCPFVSPDGKTLYFTSNRKIEEAWEGATTYSGMNKILNGPQNGFDDIYQMDFRALLDTLSSR